MADYVISTTISLKDEITGKLKTVGKSSEDLKIKFNSLSHSTQSVEDKIKSSTKTMEKYKKAISGANSAISKLSSIGIKAIKWGAVGLAGAGIGGLKIGADFEKYRSMLETAVENNENMRKLGNPFEVTSDYYKWANEYANKTPFSNDEVIEATVKLASYGYDPKKMMGIIGDMAGAMGKPLEQALEAMVDAGVGELERLTEFGIKKEDIIAYGEEIGFKDLVDSKGSIKDMDKFMKTLVSLVQSKTKGGTEKLAKTLQGQISTTIGLFKFNVAKLVGITEGGTVRQSSLIDRVKTTVEKFNNYLSSEEGKKAVDEWVKTFDDSLPKIIDLGKAIEKKFKEIAEGNFIEQWTESINNFNPQSINDFLDSTIQKIDEIISLAEKAGGTWLGAKIGGIFGPVGAGVGAGVGFLTTTIPDALEGAWKGFKAAHSEGGDGAQWFNENKNDYDYTLNSNQGFKAFKPDLINEKLNINITMSNVTFNNGMDINDFTDSLAEKINNGE